MVYVTAVLPASRSKCFNQKINNTCKQVRKNLIVKKFFFAYFFFLISSMELAF